jgi:NAD(P)-dependent dehydrogenase (short-subunit alcohol dehydrogenase family)
MELAGKSALVAGGASGLGEATARALVEAGAAVTIADLNAEKGEALAAELGPGATFVQADVTNEDGVSAAVARAASHDDGLRISVCCAGRSESPTNAVPTVSNSSPTWSRST